MSMTCLEGQHTVLCSTYGHEGDGAPNNKMRYKDENLGTSTSLLCSDSPVWSPLVFIKNGLVRSLYCDPIGVPIGFPLN